VSDPRWDNYNTRLDIERRRYEKEQRQHDIEDIDEEINWAYSQMRIIEAHLEQALERGADQLTEHQQKRVDKALVVTRTGLKMLKKVVKTRAPHLDTAAWRDEAGAGSRRC
jgi:hypothetical protein